MTSRNPTKTSNRFQIFADIPQTDETVVVKYKTVKRKPQGEVKCPKKKKVQDQPRLKPHSDTLKFGYKSSDSLALALNSSHVVDDDELDLLAVMQIQIGSEETSGLLDGGAGVNCIDNKFLKRARPDAIVKPSRKTLVTANKSPMKTYGIYDGVITIGGVKFTVSFYVCKGISHKVILGNKFLLKNKANICYEKLRARFRTGSKTVTVPFGVFYRPVEDINAVFEALDVESSYIGPCYVRSTKKVVIPPRTIKWIKVDTHPHNLSEETLFIGNPHLVRNYKLIVSDFLLAPQKTNYIQITNVSDKHKSVYPDLNLAIEVEFEDIFLDAFKPVNSISVKKSSDDSKKFNINPNMSPDQEEKGLSILNKYEDVFVADVSEMRKCKYPPIRFKYDESKPVRLRNYRMSPDEKQFAEEYIDKLLKADLVEYCTSVYCTPILVVPKPSHVPDKPNFRMVQDFRKVNRLLEDIRYPIADPQELMDSFQGKKWHSVTDNIAGYSQLEIHPDCRDITAFDSPSGSRFRWKSLPMGLSIAPAIYALAMDHLLMDLKKQGKIQNYFDDSHLGTVTFEEHIELLREYFEVLRKYGIKLNIRKSTFFQTRVKFLGVEIDGENAYISPKRVAAIKELPVPQNKDDLRSTIGVFGYNRRFIKDYSKKSYPLQSLMKEDVPFIWSSEQQAAFDTLKNDLSSYPALRLYNPKLNNRVCTDASYRGLGISLYQQDPETKRYHPIAFGSRKLKNSELKLPVYYLECAAIVLAFVKFRCYLQNRNVETEVLTDHRSLQSLLKTPKPEGPLAKHIMYLSQFKFTLKYRPGKENLDSDALSRAPIGDIPEKSVDELVEEVFPDRIIGEHNLSAVAEVTTRAQLAREKDAEKHAKEIDQLNKTHDNSELMSFVLNKSSIIRDLQQADEEISKLTQQVKSKTLTARDTHYRLKNGLLYWELNSKLLIVVPRSCRKYVLSEYHDNRGHRKTKHLVQNILVSFWWRTLHADANVYVRSCKYCMMTDNNPRDKPGLLAPALPQRMFSQISCDFVGRLPLSKNKNEHFCVIVDSYTKYMWARPVKSADTVTAIKCLESFTLQFGLCDSYTSDGASYFTSFAFQKMLNKWDIFHNAFRRVPHCNGQCERSIKSLKELLSQFLLQFGDDWDSYLEFATFLYNVNYHDTIKCSPFFAVHGYNPVVPGILQLLPSTDENLEDKLKRHSKLLTDLKVRIETAQIKYKENYDKNRKEVHYSVGQLVRVKNESDDISWPNKRIQWVGPFKIVGKKSDRFYFVLIREKSESGKNDDLVKEYHVRNIRPFTDRPEDLQVQAVESCPLDSSTNTINAITSFRHSASFLSNCYPVLIEIDGIVYPSVEHAYQAQKSNKESAQKTIANAFSAEIAQKLGRDLHLRSDWDKVRLKVMEKCLQTKFKPGSELANLLLQTGNDELVKGNFDHDQYFGTCLCEKHRKISGRNKLGKLLMSIRKELQTITGKSIRSQCTT